MFHGGSFRPPETKPETVCVRTRLQRQEYRRSEGAPHPQDAGSSRVTLFNDYAVLDRRNKSYVIGSLVRLVRVGDHGRQEYKRPVPYDAPKKESITCFFQAYNLIGQNAFEVTTAKLLEFPFKDILIHVNLTISESTDTLLIPEEEHSEVKKSVEKVFRQPRPRRTITNELESPSSSSDDGRVVVEVQPEQQTEGGPKRSTRKRNAIFYDS